ncbi:thioesterase thiol ester dehydrase-isomerase [Gautieria morchelliformis]|nr:thioesterase thiol ester dehydrase-isomerase [Gautieria morchelliformis]
MSADELKARTRASYPHFMLHQTRWSDNDQYGHLNNSIYQHYFDTVINAYLIQFCGLEPLTSRTIGLAVATSCQYFQPLSFPRQLYLGLAVNVLGRSSVTYEVGVFGADDSGGPAAVGTFTHVFVDSKSRRPASMSPELRTGLEKLLVQRTAVACKL